ncbi:fimbria/pilus outer membrane usher protein [Antarcticimicrobium sediminis]|uniref:fimbria/pilus outer membrane usher protein n=1 Tax=Antarcticimicrobium sediminis TaxID=2546227 RepID=UPI001404EBA4|nr:fimbria/pilus outer membrane usher protein [Antarcticimicrobium sediminis]
MVVDRSQDRAGPDAVRPVPDDGVPLFLLVSLNGVDTGLIAEFLWFSQGNRLGILPNELKDIGLTPPRATRSILLLDDIPGLSYRYDVAAQEIEISAAPERLQRRIIKGRTRPTFTKAQPGYGALLNYHLTGNIGRDVLSDGFRVEGMFASLEGRIYAPFGVLRTTGSVSAQNLGFEGAHFHREDTTYSYSSPGSLVTFSAGDVISSGQPWTRSIRMGGIQIRRDFSLRSDIVTDPQLAYSGTAAVPTAIDVYVDNVNAWSGTVPPGPFTLTDLPMIGESGEAQIVIRDEAGNEQTKTIGFFATENLLRRGQLDFSFEAGVARNNFAQDNSAYSDERMALASLRYGLTDRVTLQGHVEASSDLVAASGGISSVLFNRAEFGLAVGASRFQGHTGYLGHFDLRTDISGVDLRISSTRHSGDYADLAYVTALVDGTASSPDLLRPAKAQDVLSISKPLFSDLSTLGINLINIERADSHNTILSGSFSRKMKWQEADFHVSGFKDVSTESYGLSIGLSVPLGKKARASSDLRRDSSGQWRAGLHLRKPLDQDVGSAAYRVDIEKTGKGDDWAFLGGSYRGRYGVIDGRLQRADDGAVAAAASLEGALVLSDAGLVAGNRISDGFAVVDLGVADVPILLNNQPVAKTGVTGKALVAGLVPYQENRVSVDPSGLPLNTNMIATAIQAVPARRSGTTLRMGRGVGSSALIVLHDKAGHFVPVGSEVVLNGRTSDFVVGYDGEVWLEKLHRQNRIEVIGGALRCTARFDLPSTETAYLELECL